MNTLLDAVADFRRLGAAYAGHLTLARWGDTSQGGMTITLRLEDDPEMYPVHPFKGLPAHPKEGQRFVAVLVAVADQAEEPITETAPIPSRGREDGGASCAASAPPSSEPKPAWREKPLPTRAGIICNDDLFHRYLQETRRAYWVKIGDVNGAAEWLRDHCQIESRSELANNPDAAQRYLEVEALFQNYRGRGEWAREEGGY